MYQGGILAFCILPNQKALPTVTCRIRHIRQFPPQIRLPPLLSREEEMNKYPVRLCEMVWGCFANLGKIVHNIILVLLHNKRKSFLNLLARYAMYAEVHLKKTK